MKYLWNKKTASLLFLILSFLCFSQDGEEYLKNLDNQIDVTKSDDSKLKEIASEELKKFVKTKDSLYLIASKYTIIHTSDLETTPLDKFIHATEIAKMNASKYPIASSVAYNMMSVYLKDYSPEMSLYFTNEAIANEQKFPHKNFLPHLLHTKGRLYYILENYDKAHYYFNEALKNYKKDDYLYVSSMHNNFGLVFSKKKKYNQALKEFNIALAILYKIKKPTEEEKEFRYLIYGNIGEAYYFTKNLKKAEELWEKEFLYYYNRNIKNKNFEDIIVTKELFNVYTLNKSTEKKELYISLIKNLENRIQNTKKKIIISDILLDYYKQNGNSNKINEYNTKIINLSKKQIDEEHNKFVEINNYLNQTILDDINQKYTYKLLDHKRTTYWFILTGILSFLILAVSFFTIRIKRKRERKIYHQKNTINEQNKLIMEKNIKLQDEKIKNLHLTLNLKQKTEQAFLDKVKKVRKSKNIDTEEILKELYFDLNNLINIDKKNHDYSEENHQESNRLQEKLSTLFPHLTAQELKLCVYFRLNLSSKEIAILEKISDGSVRVYKSKLKTKLSLKKEDSLEHYLNNI